MKKKELIISILLHSLFIVSVYIVQGVIFPHIRVAGFVPLLLPTASVGIALYEGRYTGGITGLFAGVLCDVSFNQPTGVFTVLLTLTGLIVGTMSDTIVLKGFVTYYISCAAILVISAIVQMFPLVLSPSQSIPVQALIATAIQQTIYSLILAFPMWFFIRALGKRTERISPSGRTY